MIVYAAKLSARKIAVGLLAAAIAVGGAWLLWPQQTAATAGEDVPTAGGLTAKMKSNEDRVALLESLGWQVNETPLSEREVQIPKSFDETYQTYNAIQLEQGLDLTPYQGKRATLYTYALLEYPTGEVGVVANLLVRKNRLIAADISSSDSDGFVHAITKTAS